jgi:ABC-type sugar transport system permease subunit
MKGQQRGVPRRGVNLSKTQTGVLMALPAFVLTFALLIYPIINVFWLSLHRANLARPDRFAFVGLQNFENILFHDSQFWTVIRNTLFFTVVVVVSELILGFFIALALNREFAGRGLFRTLSMTSWVIPPVVTGLIWAWILNDTYGIINYLLRQLNIISRPILWLGDIKTAMWSVIAIDIWRETPFFCLNLLAGMQTIPHELYEAAHIDGANRFQSIVHVMLPMIKPAILVSLLIRTMSAFKTFDLIYVLTHGGPAGQTEVLATYIHRTAFGFMDMGKGSALSVIMLGIVVVCSIFYIKLLGQDSEV